MLEVNNNVTKINNENQIYDKSVSNPAIKYGTNSIDNLYTHLENTSGADKIDKIEKLIEENDKYLKSLPPLEYEYRYMPNTQKGTIDKKALLKTAYQEMGEKNNLSIAEIDAIFAPNKDFSSNALDINTDKKIDVGEYSASILAADMLSKSPTPDFNNIDGTINSQGFNAILEYSHKSNLDAAKKLYSNIYNNYNLADATKEFKPE